MGTTIVKCKDGQTRWGDGEVDIDDIAKIRGLDLEQMQSKNEGQILFDLASGKGYESEGAKSKNDRGPFNV